MAALICAAAYRSCGLSPKIEFIQYGTKEEEELQPGPGQLFVDIAPPESKWKEWQDVKPIVLDHHETREHITKGLDGVYGYPEYSGASLAFTHVLVPLWHQANVAVSMQQWAKYVILAQIRDTWQSDHPEWFDAASFGQGLAFYGSRDLLESLNRGTLDLDEVLKIGRKAYKRILRKAEYVAASSYTKEVNLEGEVYKLAFFNSTEKNISEVGHHLLEVNGYDLAAGFFSLYQDGKFRIIVSLRTGERLNARKIAEVFKGGGGHPKAAGFKMDGPGEYDALAHTFGDIVGYVESAIGHSIRDDL